MPKSIPIDFKIAEKGVQTNRLTDKHFVIIIVETYTEKKSESFGFIILIFTNNKSGKIGEDNGNKTVI